MIGKKRGAMQGVVKDADHKSGPPRRQWWMPWTACRFFLQLSGLFSDFAFQVLVHGLQMCCHAIETIGQGAKLVTGDALDTGVKIT